MKVFIAGVLFCAVAFGATIPEDQSEDVEEFRLPEGIPTCYEDDPELNKCMKEAVAQILPQSNNGIKSLGIQPVDPFVIDRSAVSFHNGLIQGSIKMKNLKTYGMSQGIIKDIRMKINGDILKTEMDIHFPKIFMEGLYKADIKLNDLKLNPKGRFNTTMNDIDITQTWGGKLMPSRGHKYLVIDEFDMKPEVGNMKFSIEGIFPDPVMNDLANNFLNQYWPSLYKSTLADTRQYWEPIMVDGINNFLGRVPFDLLIKKRE